jgi:hypothetical protein
LGEDVGEQRDGLLLVVGDERLRDLGQVLHHVMMDVGQVLAVDLLQRLQRRVVQQVVGLGLRNPPNPPNPSVPRATAA